jgi:hypothetical protein
MSAKKTQVMVRLDEKELKALDVLVIASLKRGILATRAGIMRGLLRSHISLTTRKAGTKDGK